MSEGIIKAEPVCSSRQDNSHGPVGSSERSVAREVGVGGQNRTGLRQRSGVGGGGAVAGWTRGSTAVYISRDVFCVRWQREPWRRSISWRLPSFLSQGQSDSILSLTPSSYQEPSEARSTET
jgi:hypothetical protein